LKYNIFFLIEGWNLKEKLIEQKDKKIIKRMKFKIEIKNWLNGEVEKKNQFNKKAKK